MTQTEWLAICARDDEYHSVQDCDTPIQDRRALLGLVKKMADEMGGIDAVLERFAQTVNGDRDG